MINDIKKWELLVKNKLKTLQSFKLLVELIEGNTIDIPETCFYPSKEKNDEKDCKNWVEGMVQMKKDLDDQNKEVQDDFERGIFTVPFKKKGYD